MIRYIGFEALVVLCVVCGTAGRSQTLPETSQAAPPAVGAIAQTSGPGTQPLAVTGPIEPPARVGVGLAETRLTLQEAVEMAIRNNLEVDIERTNVATAAQAIRAAQGAFDPVLQFRPVWEDATTPASSVLQAADGRSVSRSFGSNFRFVQPLTAFGTRLSADFENARVATNNPFTSLNPYFNSRLLFGVQQPLLRGFRTDPLRTEVKVRRRAASLSETNLRLGVIDVIARVEQAYWDLLAARQEVEVQRESAELARQQLERNRRMVKAGTLAQVELFASEAELQRRLDTLYTSVGAVTTAENRLKTLLSRDPESSIWNDVIVPTDARRPTTLGEIVDLRELTAQALRERLELEASRGQSEIARLQRELAASQRLPQVDLVAGYANSGLAGTLLQRENPFTALNTQIVQQLNILSQQAGLQPIAPPSLGRFPPDLIGGYGGALDNLFSRNFQTYQVGLNLDLNFRNRTAEANLAQAQIAERRIGLQRTQIQQLIQQQVRDAVQGIVTARQRVAAATASTRAAREQLESETRLFQAGGSTNFLVLTRQSEYAESRLREVFANLELNRSVSRLEQSLGATFRSYNIRLQ